MVMTCGNEDIIRYNRRNQNAVDLTYSLVVAPKVYILSIPVTISIMLQWSPRHLDF